MLPECHLHVYRDVAPLIHSCLCSVFTSGDSADFQVFIRKAHVYNMVMLQMWFYSYMPN